MTKERKGLLSPKWEYGISVVLFLLFSVLTVWYIIDIIKGDTTRLTILSSIIYTVSAVAWLLKALQDRKRLQQS